MQDRHRESAANGGQPPGLPEERMPFGLVSILVDVVMALAPPRIRLTLPVPDTSRRARILPRRL